MGGFRPMLVAREAGTVEDASLASVLGVPLDEEGNLIKPEVGGTVMRGQ
jgi:hypothetical protein